MLPGKPKDAINFFKGIENEENTHKNQLVSKCIVCDKEIYFSDTLENAISIQLKFTKSQIWVCSEEHFNIFMEKVDNEVQQKLPIVKQKLKENNLI